MDLMGMAMAGILWEILFTTVKQQRTTTIPGITEKVRDQ